MKNQVEGMDTDELSEETYQATLVEHLLRGYKEAEAWELVIKRHFEF